MKENRVNSVKIIQYVMTPTVAGVVGYFFIWSFKKVPLL